MAMTIKRWQLISKIMRNTNIVTAEQDNKGEMGEGKKLHKTLVCATLLPCKCIIVYCMYTKGPFHCIIHFDPCGQS